MPYQNVPDDMQDKMESCVMGVMEKDSSLTKESAIRICYRSVVDGKSLSEATAEVKSGARHSSGDVTIGRGAKQKARGIVDDLEALGFVDEESNGEVIERMKTLDDTVIAFGTEVKALGNGKVAGYLVRFSTADEPDFTGDFFTKETDFGQHAVTPVYYHHGLDTKLRKRQLGAGSLIKDEFGVWIESQLNLRDEYEKAVYEMVETGKQGWSSGSASHLVERQPEGKANRIIRWPLGLDASLTPTPAEPRNSAIPLKTYISGLQAGQPKPDGKTAPPLSEIKAQGGTNMPDETKVISPDVTALMATVKSLTDSVTAQSEQIKTLTEKVNAPALPIGGITAVKDLEAEKPFKNLGEQLFAIKQAAFNPGAVDRRLLAVNEKAIKATGASESLAADGGFLLQQEFATEALARVYSTGAVMNLVNKRAVGAGANGLIINVINETSRADGSRFGGVRAYWLNEAGTKTASRPKFRRFALNLEKLIGLYYATDELLQDVTALEGEVNDMFAKEIQFVSEDAIVNGNGAGMPQGVLSAPSIVSVAKETGQAAATIVYQNLIKMWARLWAPSRAKSVWFINQDAEPQLDQLFLAAGTAGIEPRFVTYGPDGLMRIKNRPVVPVEYCATLGTVGDIILADMSGYRWIDKGGVQAAASIHVQFVTDETAFRWVYRCNGAPFENSAITPKNGTNTLSQFVSLATRA